MLLENKVKQRNSYDLTREIILLKEIEKSRCGYNNSIAAKAVL